MESALDILAALKADADVAERITRCSRRGCAARIVGSIDLPVERVTSSVRYNGPIIDEHSCTAIRGACGCVHAEQRLIIAALKGTLGPMVPGKMTLLCTLSPCTTCSHIILLSSLFDKVYFLRRYDTDTKGISLLARAGLQVYHKQ